MDQTCRGLEMAKCGKWPAISSYFGEHFQCIAALLLCLKNIQDVWNKVKYTEVSVSESHINGPIDTVIKSYKLASNLPVGKK